jgi:4-oxalocrotonate tautomerase
VPLVRIDLAAGKPPEYRRTIGEIVHEALKASAGVPEHDRFQIITQHDRDDFIFDREYLGIHRTDDLIMIQIFLNQGRTTQQKEHLYKEIADGLARSLDLRREDAFITLVEVDKVNWSFGNGVAQYATDVTDRRPEES